MLSQNIRICSKQVRSTVLKSSAMKMRVAMLTAFLVCLAAVVRADQFGDVVFQKPDGWSSVQQADSMLLIPPDIPKGFLLTLAIRKGEDMNDRTLRQFLDDKLKSELATGAKVISSAPVNGSWISSGLPVLTTTRFMSASNGSAYLVQYFVLKVRSRGETITVISNSEDLVKKYSDVIGKLIAALQFPEPPK